MDLKSRDLWSECSKDNMLRYTDLPYAPWRMVDADVKRHARLNCIADLLAQIPYRDTPPSPPDLSQHDWARDEDDRARMQEDSYVERLY